MEVIVNKGRSNIKKFEKFSFLIEAGLFLCYNTLEYTKMV